MSFSPRNMNLTLPWPSIQRPEKQVLIWGSNLLLLFQMEPSLKTPESFATKKRKYKQHTRRLHVAKREATEGIVRRRNSHVSTEKYAIREEISCTSSPENS